MSPPRYAPHAPNLPGFAIAGSTREACWPFALRDGNDTAVLMIHGFTGSPADFRDFARTYPAHGMDVFVPLWPGHGSTPAALEPLGFDEMYSPISALAAHLRQTYDRVHVLGLSYGGVLACLVCLSRPVDSLCLLAPALYLDLDAERKMRLVRRFHLYRWHHKTPKKSKLPPEITPYPLNFAYSQIPLFPASQLHRAAAAARRNLKHLAQPVIHFHGDLDPTTPLQRNHAFLERTLPHYAFHSIPRGQHVLTLSPQAQQIAQHHVSWINKNFSSKPKP